MARAVSFENARDINTYRHNIGRVGRIVHCHNSVQGCSPRIHYAIIGKGIYTCRTWNGMAADGFLFTFRKQAGIILIASIFISSLKSSSEVFL
jgi:hypothetical protein